MTIWERLRRLIFRREYKIKAIQEEIKRQQQLLDELRETADKVIYGQQHDTK